MASQGQKILSYHDVLLRSSDVALLDGPFWLNDNIIAFWMQYLEKDVYKESVAEVAFVSPDVVQLIKLGVGGDLREELQSLSLEDKDLILMPVNDCMDLDMPGGCHWSLLVYHKDSKKFEHYDSSKRSNAHHAARIASMLKPLLFLEQVEVLEINCAQQNNSYDCGLYVLLNLQNVCLRHFRKRGIGCGESVTLSNAMESNRHTLKQLIRRLSNKQ